MKRLILFIVVICSICTAAFASKAVTRPMKVVLQDGTETTVALYGDENFSYWASTKGELIVREGKMWRKATQQEIASAKQTMLKAFQTDEGIHASEAPFPHEGNPKVLVILVSFADKSFHYSRSDFDRLLNSTDYDSSEGYHSYSSLAQYFDDMSGTKFRPEFDVVGPYVLPGTVAYYGSNAQGSDYNRAKFIEDACAAADADVNFADYDLNGDGCPDTVCMIYAGNCENWGGSSDLLWPRSGSGNYGKFDGMKINRYCFVHELIGGEGVVDEYGNPYMTGIGVVLHEFLHCMGLPDVYPTSKWSDVTDYDNQSMEYWDVMDNGENIYNGYYPTPLTAFERELFGWMKIDTLDKASNIELKPLQDGGKAYRVLNDNDQTGNEYYILEAIPNDVGTGWYSKMLGNGMIVTHINYSTTYFDNFRNPNNVAGSPRWTILPADGILESSWRISEPESSVYHITSAEYRESHSGDTYPGSMEVTEITDYKPYIGTIDKPITDIVQNGFNVRFKFMGGEVSGIDTPEVNDNNSNSGIVNIAGQRVNENYRGIVIKGGKKVLW